MPSLGDFSAFYWFIFLSEMTSLWNLINGRIANPTLGTGACQSADLKRRYGDMAFVGTDFFPPPPFLNSLNHISIPP